MKMKFLHFRNMTWLLFLVFLIIGFLNCSNQFQSQFSNIESNNHFVKFNDGILTGGYFPEPFTDKRNDSIELVFDPNLVDNSAQLKIYLNNEELENGDTCKLVADCKSIRLENLPQGDQKVVILVLGVDGSVLEQHEYKWVVQFENPIMEFFPTPPALVTTNSTIVDLKLYTNKTYFYQCWIRTAQETYYHYNLNYYVNCAFPFKLEDLKNNTDYEFRVRITSTEDGSESHSEIRAVQFRTKFD